jgi:hypothetical protein
MTSQAPPPVVPWRLVALGLSTRMGLHAWHLHSRTGTVRGVALARSLAAGCMQSSKQVTGHMYDSVCLATAAPLHAGSRLSSRSAPCRCFLRLVSACCKRQLGGQQGIVAGRPAWAAARRSGPIGVCCSSRLFACMPAPAAHIRASGQGSPCWAHAVLAPLLLSCLVMQGLLHCAVLRLASNTAQPTRTTTTCLVNDHVECSNDVDSRSAVQLLPAQHALHSGAISEALGVRRLLMSGCLRVAAGHGHGSSGLCLEPRH